MSNTKEQLNTLITSRQGGEAGNVVAIAEAARLYSLDSTLMPSAWGEVSKKSRGAAVTTYGGYISYKHGIDPRSVYALSDVIASKYASLDGKWDMDTKSFVSLLSDLKSEHDEAIAQASALSISLGKDGEVKAKGLVKQTDALVSVAVVTPTALHEAKESYRRLGAWIAKQEGNSLPIAVIAEAELISA